MSTILLYDYDYFHYQHVIPNLECAKLAAYFKKKKHIVVLSNNFEPSMYTEAYFRKEYEDGLYDKKILLSNVKYGGRAFSEIYLPFDKEIEQTIPDFSIYNKYKAYYGKNKADIITISAFLNSLQLRLSYDEQHMEDFPFNQLTKKHKGIFFHDYHLENFPEIVDILLDICNYNLSKGITYRVGNKYPIQVYTYTELKKWLQLPSLNDLFFIQYNGIFTEEELINLVEDNPKSLKHICYNFIYGFTSDQVFFDTTLYNIYRQLLFLRKNNIKFLLNIDTDFFKTQDIYNTIMLILDFFKSSFTDYTNRFANNLYGFCKIISDYPLMQKYSHSTIEEKREIFQYVRANNYPLFDLFYNNCELKAEGGKLVNE